MTDRQERRIPWFLWPFYALWRLLGFILDATGRLVLAVLGIALMEVKQFCAAQGQPGGVPGAGFLAWTRRPISRIRVTLLVSHSWANDRVGPVPASIRRLPFEPYYLLMRAFGVFFM